MIPDKTVDKMMKLIFSIILGIAINATAQTNFDILICKNAIYTNATIIRETPAYVVVSYSGGLAKVAHTNLPDTLQKQFNFDPEKAQATLEAEAKNARDVQQKKVDYVNYLASLRGPNKVVRIKSLNPDGTCIISEEGTVLMGGIPPATANYFARISYLRNAIANQSGRAKQMARDAERADANAATYASGDASYVNSAMAQRQRANNMVVNANQAAEQVAEMKNELSELEADFSKYTGLVAYSTGLKNSGITIWQCVGLHQE